MHLALAVASVVAIVAVTALSRRTALAAPGWVTRAGSLVARSTGVHDSRQLAGL